MADNQGLAVSSHTGSATGSSLSDLDSPEQAQTDSQVISLLYDFSLDLDDFNVPFMNHMEECFGIYEGDKEAHYGQDLNGKSIVKQLEAEGRPADVENIAFPLINLVAGIQMDTRYTIKALGRAGEDTRVADGTSEAMRFVSDQNSLDRRASRQFFEQILCGRGWLVCEQEFDERDIFGTKTVIRNAQPGEIAYDRKSRELDLSDADVCRRSKIISRGTANITWPDKIYELDQYYTWLDSQIHSSRISDARVSALRKDIVISEFYWKVRVQKKLLIDLKTTKIVDATNVPDERLVEYFRAFPGRFSIIIRPGTMMKTAHMVGNPAAGVLLDQGKSQYADNYYPYIPAFGYRSRDRDFGIILNILDQVRGGNKSASKIREYINKLPKTRIITDDPDLEARFKQGDEIITVTEGKNFKVLDPSKFPEALATILSDNRNLAEKISNITPELRGIKTGQDSGVVVDTRRQSALSAIFLLFDNHSASMELAGRVMMSRNKQYMTEEKIARLLGPKKAFPEVIAAMKEKGVEDYDMSVAQVPNNPGLRWENFKKIEAIRASWPELIPPDVFVDATDVVQKDEIITRMAKAQEGGGGEEVDQNPTGELQ